MSRHRVARMDYLRDQAWRSSSSPLKRQRLLKGLSLVDVADAAHVSRSTVIHAEAGGAVSDATWWALSEGLNVPREWIDPQFSARVRPGLIDCAE